MPLIFIVSNLRFHVGNDHATGNISCIFVRNVISRGRGIPNRACFNDMRSRGAWGILQNDYRRDSSDRAEH